MKKKNLKKPSKAVVLTMLGAILIMAIIVIWVVMGNLYKEESKDIGRVQQIQEPTEQITCDSTNLGFEIKSAEYFGKDIEIVLENQGTAPIDKVKIVMMGEKDEEETMLSVKLVAGFKTIHITPNPIIGEVKEITMYPVLRDDIVCETKSRRSDVESKS